MQPAIATPRIIAPGKVVRLCCAEPFRIFFPLGALLGVIGVSLWPLFYLGAIDYPGVAHSRMMIEGFMASFIFGFLGTAGPRITSAAPFSMAEVGTLFTLDLARRRNPYRRRTPSGRHLLYPLSALFRPDNCDPIPPAKRLSAAKFCSGRARPCQWNRRRRAHGLFCLRTIFALLLTGQRPSQPGIRAFANPGRGAIFYPASPGPTGTGSAGIAETAARMDPAGRLRGTNRHRHHRFVLHRRMVPTRNWRVAPGRRHDDLSWSATAFRGTRVSGRLSAPRPDFHRGRICHGRASCRSTGSAPGTSFSLPVSISWCSQWLLGWSSDTAAICQRSGNPFPSFWSAPRS